MAIKPNPLNKFSSFNYIWFLDVASSSEYASGSYKSKRGRIARSGGIADTAGAALQTADEERLGVKGEYFIDNVRTNAYISPNPYSGVANVTKIEFEITEPYSIGLFLQTLELAARESGFPNYLNATFVLGVEFTGYDPNGAVSTIEKRVLAIKITKIKFNVTAAGSVYQVEAIPYSHEALSDDIQRIKTNISIKGDTVEEILTSTTAEGITTTNTRPQGDGAEVVNGARSLIQELNRQEQEAVTAQNEGSEQQIVPNEYVILFPNDPADLTSTNRFASYKIAENMDDMGIQEFGIENFVVEENNGYRYYQRGNLTISENGRVYQFRQGTKIEKIIEEVLLTSEWAEEIFEIQPDERGFIDWYKIFTKIEIIDSQAVSRLGAPPMRFIYKVVPFKVHISSLASRFQEINYNSSVRDAVKGYNYIYTGENIDVIDFNINIDYAWIQAVANNTQRSNQTVDQGGGNKIIETPASVYDRTTAARAGETGSDPISNRGFVSETETNHGGGGIDTEKTRVAREFNSAIINSNADLIKVNLTIWGDPYYLADSDAGGYVSRGARSYENSDGTIDYLRSEVDILLKFSSAVDYKNDILTPNVARQFSGVYKVIRVNSMFENGMFRQELELVRRPRQDDITVANVASTIDAMSRGAEPFLLPSRSGVNAGDIALFLRQAEEFEKMFNIFGQLKLQDLAQNLNITPFGLISQLDGFSRLFNQVRQIRSSISNLGNLAGSLNISNLNGANLQQLTSQLTDVSQFFNQAFTGLNVSSITQVLNQDLSNIGGQIQNQITGALNGQIQGVVSQVRGAVGQIQGLAGGAENALSALTGSIRITPQGITGTPIASAPPLQGLTSLIRPQPRPPNLNATGTRLVDTPNGPIRVVSGAGGRNNVTPSISIPRIGPQ
jgi:hypothetical protein